MGPDAPLGFRHAFERGKTTAGGATTSLGRALEARGVAWDEPLHELDVVDSTNLWLRERSREGIPPWSAVTAERQSAGRGRHGRRWISTEGNLFLSVLCPGPPPDTVSLVPLLAGAATARALRETAPDVHVKWPNDVLLGGRKLAGILAEGGGGPGGLARIVVGVGVNVASTPVLRDSEVGAASLAEGAHVVDAAAVAAAILDHLRLWYDALLRRETRRVLEEWRALSVDWWGRLVTIQDGSCRVTGRLVDVDEVGRLVVELPDRSRRSLLAGDVTRVRTVEDGP